MIFRFSASFTVCKSNQVIVLETHTKAIFYYFAYKELTTSPYQSLLILNKSPRMVSVNLRRRSGTRTVCFEQKSKRKKVLKQNFELTDDFVPCQTDKKSRNLN